MPQHLRSFPEGKFISDFIGHGFKAEDIASYTLLILKLLEKLFIWAESTRTHAEALQKMYYRSS